MTQASGHGDVFAVTDTVLCKLALESPQEGETVVKKAWSGDYFAMGSLLAVLSLAGGHVIRPSSTVEVAAGSVGIDYVTSINRRTASNSFSAPRKTLG